MNRRIQRRFIPSVLEKDTDLHPLLRRVYAARGITESADLDLSLEFLQHPSTLKGVDQAANELAKAIKAGRRILVVGDFDADGATGTALAIKGLKDLGAPYVDYIVPNRFTYGYGLTPEIVELAREKEPDLIITVDNGISSVDGVAFARELGITVVITDHHLPGSTIPAANVIVNPNQPGCSFASKNLAGVGVIFYVMLALRHELRKDGWFSKNNIEEPNLANFLDLVAVGTVSDVVRLDYNNRILVNGGLRRMRSGNASPGIMALIAVAGREHEKIVSSDIGFAIGPRLNAAGRLSDMSLGIECLLARNFSVAMDFAVQLDKLNNDRKKLEAEMKDMAIASIKDLRIHTDEKQTSGMVLYDPIWHEGLVGIIAGRIKDMLNCPTIVFSDSALGLKGSGRSIDGVHLRDVLEVISVKYPGLILKFGGHAMAVGLSISRENLDKFSKAFEKTIEETSEASGKEQIIESDGEVKSEWFCLEDVREVYEGGPWGNGFPAPVFDGRFDVLDSRLLGEKHLKLKLAYPCSRYSFDAIAFNVDAKILHIEEGEKIEIAYRLEINYYRKKESIQAVIEEIHILGKDQAQ